MGKRKRHLRRAFACSLSLQCGATARTKAWTKKLLLCSPLYTSLPATYISLSIHWLNKVQMIFAQTIMWMAKLFLGDIGVTQDIGGKQAKT